MDIVQCVSLSLVRLVLDWSTPYYCPAEYDHLVRFLCDRGVLNISSNVDTTLIVF